MTNQTFKSVHLLNKTVRQRVSVELQCGCRVEVDSDGVIEALFCGAHREAAGDHAYYAAGFTLTDICRGTRAVPRATWGTDNRAAWPTS